jgi:hypothetical protein
MKNTLVACAAIAGFLAIPVTYSTLKGYTRWYWRDTPRSHSYDVVLKDQSSGFLRIAASGWRLVFCVCVGACEPSMPEDNRRRTCGPVRTKN